MGLEAIVNVSISRQTQAVSAAGFGVPLILGVSGNWPAALGAAVVASYSSLTGVAADYATSTDEYKMAAAIFSQTPKPTKIKIGKRTAAIAQINTLTPNVASQIVQHYTVTIDGVTYDFTSDSSPTAAEVVTGLSSLINADTACNMAATGTTTLILTAKSAGLGSSVSCSSNLTNVATTPSNGAQEDLIAVSQADGDWYCLLLASRTAPDVKSAAAWLETQRRIGIFTSNDAGIPTVSTTDIASYLKGKTYFRSAVVYSSTASEYPAAALAGRVLPLDPGSETWMFKILAGITPEALTDPQKGFLDTKNVNYVMTLGGLNITMNGKVIGNDFIDIIRGIDWLQARIQENIFGKLTALDKIPFTDGGIAIVEAALREKLQGGVRVGLLASYTVSVPKASSISSSDKGARSLTGITFSAVAAGAIHSVIINGVVTL